MISPIDFIKLSKELLDSSSPNEAKLRTAIGRAYYGVYLNAAKNYATDKGFELSDGRVRSHQRFIQELKGNPDKNLQKLGNQLFQLKRAREEADYDIQKDVNKSKAAINYSLALRIEKNINSIFG